MKNKKIEKNKTYTYDEIMEIFKNAMTETAMKPTGDKMTGDKDFQVQMMLSAVVILGTFLNNMFESKEESK